MIYLMRTGILLTVFIFTVLTGFPAAYARDEFDPASLKLFTAGVPYREKYETGLYPGGKNEMPASHRRAGERVAATIRPLDTSGKPDEASGRILALALGHSNCRMYFEAFQTHLSAHAADLQPKFELLNAGTDAQQLPQIVRLEGPVWDAAQKLTDRNGYSSRQVQVLFLHTTYHSFRNRGHSPPGEFPQTMQAMQRDLLKVLAYCATTYPNLKIAYVTCDGFRHFTGFEPHVWQEAFAFKWLIESQIKHEPGAEFEGKGRRLPFLAWGPYIWDNKWDESYFSDGVHPTPKAQQIFVEKYWQQLCGDSIARPWLFKPMPAGPIQWKPNKVLVIIGDQWAEPNSEIVDGPTVGGPQVTYVKPASFGARSGEPFWRLAAFL